MRIDKEREKERERERERERVRTKMLLNMKIKVFNEFTPSTEAAFMNYQNRFFIDLKEIDLKVKLKLYTKESHSFLLAVKKLTSEVKTLGRERV